MLKKPLAVALACLLLLLTVKVSGDVMSVNSTVVSIPGQLQASNNVAFCNEGLYGFIAPCSKADGTAGDQIYSFNAVTGDVVDQRYVPFSPTTVTVDKNSDAMVVAGSLNYNSQSTVAQLYILQADQF